MPLAVGDVVDERYAIERLLGAGGFSETYQAWDGITVQRVVLKLPHMSVVGDLAVYNRYQREIDIGSRLEHPGIQRQLPTGHQNRGRRPYVVLELINGQSLRSYLRACDSLPVEEVVRIGMQLADALRYIHAQGIVHRYLKPENVLITQDGQLKLTDFGIALRLGARRLTFSHLSNVVGTPDYMAPEQVRGERGDARTDIYALGCVLFELDREEVHPQPLWNGRDGLTLGEPIGHCGSTILGEWSRSVQ